MEDLLKEAKESLTIVDVDKLLVHEETIFENLSNLKNIMTKRGQIFDPLMIDRKTKLILDGNHRAASMRSFGCKFALCQNLDYAKEEIKVGTWCPIFKTKLNQILKSDIEFEKVEKVEGMAAVEALKAPFLLRFKKENYLINPAKNNLKETIEAQKRILEKLDKPQYVADSELENCIKRGECGFYRRSFKKKEIIEFGKKKLPLPPKSTRHMINGRIININMHISALTKSREIAEKELKRKLDEVKIRKYCEVVYAIYGSE